MTAEVDVRHSMKPAIARKGAARGSSLIATLLVVVALSLMGLAFVTISETESAISVNERNGAEALSISEAGAKCVVEWFQNPSWATSSGLMPAATATALKRDRLIAFTAGGTPSNIGKYKAGGTYFCCDRPFKPSEQDRLWGTENSPDILIDTATSEGRTFLAALNAKLFANGDSGAITEIRIYAPPMAGAAVNASNFYDAAPQPERYGLATIRVTASRYRPDVAFGAAPGTAKLIARRAVTIVVSEFPFPGPQGPVQSNANIATGGNVVVHWGKMTSQGTMFVKRGLVGLPWFDAYTRMSFEQGYDSARVWRAGEKYYPGEVVYPSLTARSTTPALGLSAYIVTNGAAGPFTAGATEPSWTTGAGSTFTSTDGISWKQRARPPSLTDVTSTDFRQTFDWLPALTGQTVDDPWVQIRTRGTITNSIVTTATPQPFKYSAVTQSVTATPTAGYSNWFQLQTENRPLDYQEVVFPRIDYDFWKQVAKTGKGSEGIYYLSWVSDDNFTDGTTTKTFKEWTNVYTGAKPGFYFFDTKDGQNPQRPGMTNLTPAVSVSSGGGNTWQMAGFIYLNATSFGTTGIRGVDGHYNFPGEPFQDIGYYDVDGSGNWTALGTNTYEIAPGTAANGKWDYKEMTGNGKFDVFLTQVTRYRPDGTTVTAWKPVPYTPGCTPGENGVAGANCSEPHEPYINVVYPSTACCGGASAPNPVTLQWEDPGTTITRRPKAEITTGTLPAVNGSGICTNVAQYSSCTSNGYDRDGFMDTWAGTQDAPVLNGVFYNQGNFASQGNARYFGSVLINGDVDPTGTSEVWFDERLIKNDWPPQEWPFPRVIVTAMQTDQ
jgi:hypothetical protein